MAGIPRRAGAALHRLRGTFAVRWARFRGLSPREHALALGPWVLLIVGLALLLLAFGANVTPVETVDFHGQVPPDGDVEGAFNRTDYTYVDFEFLELPRCPLRVFALSPEEAEKFHESSVLPDPSASLGCERPTGEYQGEVALLVFHNPSSEAQDYSLRASLFRVDHPYALAIFPGFVGFLSGMVVFVLRMLASGLGRIADELAEREDWVPPDRRRRP